MPLPVKLRRRFFLVLRDQRALLLHLGNSSCSVLRSRNPTPPRGISEIYTLIQTRSAFVCPSSSGLRTKPPGGLGRLELPLYHHQKTNSPPHLDGGRALYCNPWCQAGPTAWPPPRAVLSREATLIVLSKPAHIIRPTCAQVKPSRRPGWISLLGQKVRSGARHLELF
jgi:hypothetical protein